MQVHLAIENQCLRPQGQPPPQHPESPALCHVSPAMRCDAPPSQPATAATATYPLTPAHVSWSGNMRMLSTRYW